MVTPNDPTLVVSSKPFQGARLEKKKLYIYIHVYGRCQLYMKIKPVLPCWHPICINTFYSSCCYVVYANKGAINKYK